MALRCVQWVPDAVPTVRGACEGTLEGGEVRLQLEQEPQPHQGKVVHHKVKEED